MAGHHDGDDFFSDDDLDTLPQNAFDELEQTAIRQTQATQLIKAPPSSNYGDEFDDEDLDDAEVFDAAHNVSFVGGSAQPPQAHGVAAMEQLDRNQYVGRGDMKSITGRPLKKEWPPTKPSISNRPAPTLQQNVPPISIMAQIETSGQATLPRPGGRPMTAIQDEHMIRSRQIQVSQQIKEQLQSLQPGRTMIHVEAGQARARGMPQAELQYAATQSGQVPIELQPPGDLESPIHHLALLQIQLEESRQQQEALKQELNSKAGEIAIVRSKQEKAAKEYERELTATKKLHAERIAQQQKELEAARESQKVTATELQFSKQDLLEESERVRNLRRAKEKGKGKTDDLVSTPKKNKAYRDGFDDDEIQIISPSKFPRKSNPSTPTKAGKRKRKGPESPSIPLEILHEEPPQDLRSLGLTAVVDEVFLEKIRRSDDRLNFLELVFDHRPRRDHLRTLEEFASLAFPTATNESFASIVLGKLPAINQKKVSAEFAIEFCELMISLWSRCLVELYYKPIYLLVDLVTFALELKTLAIAPFIIDSLLDVAQQTCALVAIPRFKREPCKQFEGTIDVSACLAVINLAALGCMGDREHTIRFWKWVRLDFVLMMLSQHQPPQDFDMMLQLLSMSIMKDSIGPKAADQDEQQKQVGYIIDRISLLLISSPSTPEGMTKHDPLVISNLRLQILRTFDAFCQTSWGTESLALHKFAIGRLVKLMSDELDALYDHRSSHQQSARLVCLTIRLLHHLVTKHDKSISMQKKLSEIHGGNQKYLICLARLNFSEDDLVLDADIDPEIAECAHELLELAVTPEEGDAIHAAFSSQ